MRTSTVVMAAAATVGLLAVLRQRREAAAVRAGELPPVGSAGRAEGDAGRGRLHHQLQRWRPERPRTRLGRVAAGLWASPLTALGLTATLLGGNLPRWDPEAGALVATSIRGPARWFLGQQGATAATLGHVMVVRGDTVPPALLAHESLHARQQERLGLLFGVAYPIAGACWGYRNNPFEVAARDAARVSGPAGPA